MGTEDERGLAAGPLDATEAPAQDASGDPPPTAAPPAEAAPAEEHDPWPFDLDGAPPAPELSFAGEDDLTLDAFERAVSRAVHEKLGASPPSEALAGPPRGADELVASVLGALTGKDARSALDEVRAQLAARPPADVHDVQRGADIIDLQAAREARRRPAPSDVSLNIGDALKNTFNAYLAEIAQRSGRAEFTIDAAFLKAHGPNLLGSLFQGLAQALLPQAGPKAAQPPTAAPPRDVEDLESLEALEARAAEAPEDDVAPADDARPAQAAPDAGAAATPTAPPNVSVKVDLGSILANLFKRRPPPS